MRAIVCPNRHHYKAKASGYFGGIDPTLICMAIVEESYQIGTRRKPEKKNNHYYINNISKVKETSTATTAIARMAQHHHQTTTREVCSNKQRHK